MKVKAQHLGVRLEENIVWALILTRPYKKEHRNNIFCNSFWPPEGSLTTESGTI